jgi:hypothetical protein
MRDPAEAIPEGFLPLKDAANRVGRSVRTVQRWIEEGRVEAMQHPVDRRKRLVSVSGLDVVREHAEATLDLAGDRRRRIAVERSEIMDIARGVARRVATASEELGSPWREPSDDELSGSRFVHDLQDLFAAVNGENQDPPSVLAPALERVLGVLYSNLRTGRIDVPDDFWSSSLVGRHLARARLLFFPSQSLISLNEIVEKLKMPRNRVENILRALMASRMYDPDDERWLYQSDYIIAVRYWNASSRSRRLLIDEGPDLADSEGSDLNGLVTTVLPIESRTRFKAARRRYLARHYLHAQH